MLNPINPPFLLLEFPHPQHNTKTILSAHPSKIIVAHQLDEVCPALRAVQRATEAGFYAAGYVSYEAAPAFDRAFAVNDGAKMPLLWFGIFEEPKNLMIPHRENSFQLGKWQPVTPRDEYDEAIATVRAAIARGVTYQVNYATRLRTEFVGDDFAFYRRLCAAQQPAYCAYLNLGRYRVLSASPELFFHWRDGQICTKPMKGTIRRGRWRAEDEALAAWLAASEKNRAENVMIVDLLRNDLGRIAEVGSVRVPHLFEIERYPTLFQMTSTVTATTRPNLSLEELFRAIFPGGSITGAPKISTMQLIAELENTPREVYCGAIGFITPQQEALFNIAIRTVCLDISRGVAEYGVGGGITYDSTAEDEYAEVLTKAALLTETATPFSLLETMLLKDGQYTLLTHHLERMADSAHYFDIPFPESGIIDALDNLIQRHPHNEHRVRLLLSQTGEFHLEPIPLSAPPPTQPLPVALADSPISRHNRFLYHKTTHRTLYNTHRATHPEAWDVLLWNEEGELTEFCIGNLVLELDGQRYTPPMSCGLLAGTFRAALLERGEIQERVLRREELERATRLWLINSVRGWVEVHLLGSGVKS